MLDFGSWADGEYNLPTEASDLTEADIDQIERAVKEREQ